MSFSLLPEELVDNIADYLEHGTRFSIRLLLKCGLTEGHRQSTDEPKTLLSLCLVSHQTLPSARRALYRCPFAVFEITEFQGPIWGVALSLLASLQSNHNLLGGLVRETYVIDGWVNDLIQDLRTSSGHRARQQSTRWYIDILRACPNLHWVHLRCSTPDELHNLLHLLNLLPPIIPASSSSTPAFFTNALPMSSIRDLDFGPAYESSDAADIDLQFAILEALSIAPLTSLSSLVIDYPRCGFTETFDEGLSQLSFPIKRLAITTRASRISTYLRFFPSDPSTLECVQFSGKAREDYQDLLAISKLATPNLETLDFCDDRNTYTIRLSNYFSATAASQIPIEAFHSFPRLTSLMLGSIRTLSLRFLETLLQSCPLLVRTIFVASRWISDSNSLSRDPEEVFPRSQILAVLQQFRHLVCFYPGILPSTDRKEYKGFAKAVRKLGIQIEYQTCTKEVED
ncbi:hypothetical protein JCM5353_006919 [Sporobolomyces roseus]